MDAAAEPDDDTPIQRRDPMTAKLTLIERINIRLVRSTFTIRFLDTVLRWCQRVIGAGWIDLCTRHLRIVHGLERVPRFDRSQSFILVANHRSFFDMFVVNTVLFRAGYNHRLFFPVRANFFYDRLLGFVVNGIMSFWSMYPPLFRDRKRASLNHHALTEVVSALKRGGRSVGIHPEGTRKKDDDPYTFLPAQSGVGRTIHQARTTVIPVFINGLGNDLKRQVLGNFDRTGPKIIVVFGEPIDFGTLLDQRPSARLFKTIADKTLERIGELGAEERALRARLDAPDTSSHDG